jgi:hypothetical protein
MMTMTFAPFILAYVLIASILSSAEGHRKTPRGLKSNYEYWDGEVSTVNVVNDGLSEIGIQTTTETPGEGGTSENQEISDKYGDIGRKGESDKYSGESDKYSVLGDTSIGKKKTGRSKAESECMLEASSMCILLMLHDNG